jgi:hypothetical protein
MRKGSRPRRKSKRISWRLKNVSGLNNRNHIVRGKRNRCRAKTKRI